MVGDTITSQIISTNGGGLTLEPPDAGTPGTVAFAYNGSNSTPPAEVHLDAGALEITPGGVGLRHHLR